jgi:peroxiredoxin
MNAPDETSGRKLDSAQPVSRRIFSVLLLLLAVSVTVNVLLAHKVRSLTYHRSARLDDRLLKIGTSMAPLAVKRLDGQEDVISYQGTNQPTVLYIFTPPCSWCARNLDNFKELVARKSAEYRFIGIALSKEGLPEYVAKNGLTIPVFTDVSLETRKRYKLGGTPETIVLSPEGRVLQSWIGAYAGAQKSQVEAFFQVSLPGVREPAQTGSN